MPCLSPSRNTSAASASQSVGRDSISLSNPGMGNGEWGIDSRFSNPDSLFPNEKLLPQLVPLLRLVDHSGHVEKHVLEVGELGLDLAADRRSPHGFVEPLPLL